MTGTAPDQRKRSLFTLVGNIPSLLMDLVRSEIDQLKQEMSEKFKQAGIGLGLAAAALACVLCALSVLVVAAILGLALVVPAWAAALIVVGILLLLALFLGLGAKASFKKGLPATPANTIDSVKQDVKVITGTGKRVTP